MSTIIITVGVSDVNQGITLMTLLEEAGIFASNGAEVATLPEAPPTAPPAPAPTSTPNTPNTPNPSPARAPVNPSQTIELTGTITPKQYDYIMSLKRDAGWTDESFNDWLTADRNGTGWGYEGGLTSFSREDASAMIEGFKKGEYGPPF